MIARGCQRCGSKTVVMRSTFAGSATRDYCRKCRRAWQRRLLAALIADRDPAIARDLRKAAR